MKSKELLNDLTMLIEKHNLHETLNSKSSDIATIMLNFISEKMDNSDEREFIDRMYAMYPNKCPKRGVYLGKSRKDKGRIKKLLKTYSMEEIERVFNYEIEEKYGKQYMQNFSTFLNNFPDPYSLDQPSLFANENIFERNKAIEGLVLNGITYR